MKRITKEIQRFPYFDDYDLEKNFYKVLFKPQYDLQTRELNQIQTILKEQLGRLGNHIFKNGSIVIGCDHQVNDTSFYLSVLPQFEINDELISFLNGKILVSGTKKGQILSIEKEETGYISVIINDVSQDILEEGDICNILLENTNDSKNISLSFRILQRLECSFIKFNKGFIYFNGDILYVKDQRKILSIGNKNFSLISFLLDIRTNMIRSYKYRLYPTKAQRALIEEILFVNRYLYNCALQERKSYYSKYKKSLSFNNQAAQLPVIKKHDPQMFENIYSQTLQQTLKKLDTSYANFFRRVKNGETPGFPRFKSARSFKSILFPQGNLMGAAGAKILENGNFEFFKIGEIKTIMHRPFEGRCLQVSLKRDGNQYYAIVSCELEKPKALSNSNKVIGIDLGLKTFVVTDDGTKFHHPKPYKTSKEKLAFVQRKLALKKKNSNSRRKVVATLQKVHKKISNIRDDWQHKTANHLLKHADVICMEKLEVTVFLKNNLS